MIIETFNFADRAEGRLIRQHADKPKLVALIRGLADAIQTSLEEPCLQMLSRLDIDSAEGANLDVIGAIVGQSRFVIDYGSLLFFGFDTATNADTFGDFYNSSTGSRFISAYEIETDVRELADPEYRKFIKARIYRNYSKSNREDIISSVKILFGIEMVEITEDTMKINTIATYPEVATNDLELLTAYDILPRPSGVEVVNVTSISPFASSDIEELTTDGLNYLVWE